MFVPLLLEYVLLLSPSLEGFKDTLKADGQGLVRLAFLYHLLATYGCLDLNHYGILVDFGVHYLIVNK